jgi:hypothetical protein
LGRSLFNSVVLPEPKKPVSKVIGIRLSMLKRSILQIK